MLFSDSHISRKSHSSSKLRGFTLAFGLQMSNDSYGESGPSFSFFFFKTMTVNIKIDLIMKIKTKH